MKYVSNSSLRKRLRHIRSVNRFMSFRGLRHAFIPGSKACPGFHPYIFVLSKHVFLSSRAQVVRDGCQKADSISFLFQIVSLYSVAQKIERSFRARRRSPTSGSLDQCLGRSSVESLALRCINQSIIRCINENTLKFRSVRYIVHILLRPESSHENDSNNIDVPT